MNTNPTQKVDAANQQVNPQDQFWKDALRAIVIVVVFGSALGFGIAGVNPLSLFL